MTPLAGRGPAPRPAAQVAARVVGGLAVRRCRRAQVRPAQVPHGPRAQAQPQVAGVHEGRVSGDVCGIGLLTGVVPDTNFR
jgi:hypothetical protein